MGGNRKTQRTPTTFRRVLTNCSHVWLNVQSQWINSEFWGEAKRYCNLICRAERLFATNARDEISIPNAIRITLSFVERKQKMSPTCLYYPQTTVEFSHACNEDEDRNFVAVLLALDAALLNFPTQDNRKPDWWNSKLANQRRQNQDYNQRKNT